jgi:TolB protein
VRIVALAALALALAAATAGAFPGGNGSIVYVAGRAPSVTETQLFAVGRDGSGLRRVDPAATISEFQPAVSPDGGRIAFASVRDGNPDVYVRDAAGRVARLTSHAAADAQPSWSPDGRRLAFVSERRGRAEIHVMDADGGNVRRVTTNEGPPFGPGGTPAGDVSPAWSPDGTAIAFSQRSAAASGLYLVAPDGTGLRRVTAVGTNVVDTSPTWAPDGRTLAFARLIVGGRPDESRLFTVPLSGSPQTFLGGTDGATQAAWSPDGASIALVRGAELAVVPRVGGPARVLSRFAHDDSRPAWYPDSRGLVFAAAPEVAPFRLRVLDPRGASPRTLPSYGVGALAQPEWSPEGGRIAYVSSGRLVVAQSTGRGRMLVTRPGVAASAPTWSPDGSWVAFVAGGDLFAVAADGSRRRRIARTLVAESEPAWSPDGRWLAYAAPEAPGGSLELWRIRPDGSGRRRLTDNGVIDQSPAWSPDGTRLAFVSGRTEGRFNPELWVMDSDGGRARRVQEAAASDGRESWADEQPAWSPDGNWLLYTSRGDVWIVHPDGTGATDLTPDVRTIDVAPSWQPVCTRRGGAGPNRLAGTRAAEILCGGSGPDAIAGGPARDRLFGEPGDDSIDARDGGFDVVGCGAGRDRVRADRADLVGVDCELVTRR